MAFLFSSRRRHTRWNCDWSSDVCSSALLDRVEQRLRAAGIDLALAPVRHELVELAGAEVALGRAAVAQLAGIRSEERRVGKESRTRRAAEQYKVQSNSNRSINAATSSRT